MDRAALTYVYRGKIVECIHWGSYVIVENGKIIESKGDPHVVSYHRSASKPLQAVPPVAGGAADAFGFSEREVAIMAGSHNGEEVHAETVSSMLEKIGLSEGDIAVSAPMRNGRAVSRAYHGCSGKHTGMLALARHTGVDHRGYYRIEHPVQQRMLESMARLSDWPAERIAIGIDGCGVPTFGLPLFNQTLSFQRLANPDGLREDEAQAARRIVQGANRHPMMIAGTGRICTEILSAAPGKFILKSGAEGLYLVGVVGANIGIGVKVDDGSNRGYHTFIVNLLSRMGFLTPAEAEELEKYGKPVIKNFRGETVGHIEAAV